MGGCKERRELAKEKQCENRSFIIPCNPVVIGHESLWLVALRPLFRRIGIVVIYCDFFIRRAAGKVPILNIIGLIRATGDVRTVKIATSQTRESYSPPILKNESMHKEIGYCLRTLSYVQSE